MGAERESNVGAMPELTDFEISYCALTGHVMLHAELTDTMAGVPMWPTTEFPDQTLSAYLAARQKTCYVS